MIGDDSQAFDQLRAAGLADWCDRIQASDAIQKLSQHGHFGTWRQLVADLPKPTPTHVDLQSDAVTIAGDCTPAQREQIQTSLRQLHPWRKGPFDVFGVFIDAEWRSDRKWNRIRPHVNWQHKYILDVGCGNGYYGYRMLGQDARLVVGLEPYPLYNAQFASISSLVPREELLLLPASDAVLEQPLQFFDIAVSMGVLYHCRDPLGHIAKLKNSLAPGGTLVLETIVIDGDVQTLLMPQHRYAKMRNVWCLPSALMLERMVARVGFRHIQIGDVSQTTTDEQRRTEWMTFESLADFLDPNAPNRTIEGEPAPQRAVLIAEA